MFATPPILTPSRKALEKMFLKRKGSKMLPDSALSLNL
jgi:hypothetical protein